MTKERLKYVDVLRVLAMIPVVVCHFTRSLEAAGVGYTRKILPDNICGVYLGDFGVCIFFVLSGISLMYTYQGEFDLKKYIKKRFLGIYPMFWIAWICGFLYLFYKNVGLGNYNLVPKHKILLTVFGMDGYTLWYGSNFYVLGEWFLGCIIILYILFPILKKGIDTHPVVTGIIILLIYFIGPFFYTLKIPVSIFVLFRVPEFAFGMYFVKYIKHVKLPVGICAVVTLILMEVLDVSNIPLLLKNTYIAIAMVLAIESLSHLIKSEKFYNCFASIGKYNYAIFLTHHIVIQEIAYRFHARVLSGVEVYVLFGICVIIVMFISKLLMNYRKLFN